MIKKWQIYDTDEDKVNELVTKYDINELLATILVNRDIVDEQKLEIFLNPTRNNFHDPFLMPDMEKAVERIIKAINSKEKVIIYGDYDADGITSITVLKKFLEDVGLNADYYIPNRLNEGYGLNNNAIQETSQKKIKTEINVKDIYFCFEQRLITVRCQVVTLTVKEFALFALLIMNPKRVFTYEMLMDLVWNEDYTFYSRKAVNNHISNLRKKIKIAPDIPDYIKNVYGVGYKFDI